MSSPPRRRTAQEIDAEVDRLQRLMSDIQIGNVTLAAAQGEPTTVTRSIMDRALSAISLISQTTYGFGSLSDVVQAEQQRGTDIVLPERDVRYPDPARYSGYPINDETFWILPDKTAEDLEALRQMALKLYSEEKKADSYLLRALEDRVRTGVNPKPLSQLGRTNADYWNMVSQGDVRLWLGGRAPVPISRRFPLRAGLPVRPTTSTPVQRQPSTPITRTGTVVFPTSPEEEESQQPTRTQTVGQRAVGLEQMVELKRQLLDALEEQKKETARSADLERRREAEEKLFLEEKQLLNLYIKKLQDLLSKANVTIPDKEEFLQEEGVALGYRKEGEGFWGRVGRTIVETMRRTGKMTDEQRAYEERRARRVGDDRVNLAAAGATVLLTAEHYQNTFGVDPRRVLYTNRGGSRYDQIGGAFDVQEFLNKESRIGLETGGSVSRRAQDLYFPSRVENASDIAAQLNNFAQMLYFVDQNLTQGLDYRTNSKNVETVTNIFLGTTERLSERRNEFMYEGGAADVLDRIVTTIRNNRGVLVDDSRSFEEMKVIFDGFMQMFFMRFIAGQYISPKTNEIVPVANRAVIYAQQDPRNAFGIWVAMNYFQPPRSKFESPGQVARTYAAILGDLPRELRDFVERSEPYRKGIEPYNKESLPSWTKDTPEDIYQKQIRGTWTTELTNIPYLTPQWWKAEAKLQQQQPKKDVPVVAETQRMEALWQEFESHTDTEHAQAILTEMHGLLKRTDTSRLSDDLVNRVAGEASSSAMMIERGTASEENLALVSDLSVALKEAKAKVPPKTQSTTNTTTKPVVVAVVDMDDGDMEDDEFETYD